MKRPDSSSSFLEETPYPRSKSTSRNRGNLDRSSPPRGSRTKMTMSFKAGNHVRFAEALVAISIYANAFTADAQVASDIASTSGSDSATLNLRVQVMPGGTPPLASHAPSVSPFEKPAAVVLYAGDNDLAQGALPDQ